MGGQVFLPRWCLDSGWYQVPCSGRVWRCLSGRLLACGVARGCWQLGRGLLACAPLQGIAAVLSEDVPDDVQPVGLGLGDGCGYGEAAVLDPNGGHAGAREVPCVSRFGWLG